VSSAHWSASPSPTGRSRRVFFARGYGGQFIYVVPDLDLVTVVTSDAETRGVDPQILITRTIVPAVTS
jgi:CubicO group peptidase (beta-lactamase class C family)